MKTHLLKPPDYPYPIQICESREGGKWERLVCLVIGHAQCGFHWEHAAARCCRCAELLTKP